MSELETIREFLDQKRLAIVGVSQQPKDFSRALFREFQKRGYLVVPVNPVAQEIEGARCFARVQDIEPPVSAALLMTSPAVTDQVVRDCAEAGVERVWMFRGAGTGAVNPEAVGFCKSKGMAVVPGECPMMFLPDGSWFHRLHGWVRKIAGAYPR
jgi:predicted CoA-binding protein